MIIQVLSNPFNGFCLKDFWDALGYEIITFRIKKTRQFISKKKS